MPRRIPGPEARNRRDLSRPARLAPCNVSGSPGLRQRLDRSFGHGIAWRRREMPATDAFDTGRAAFYARSRADRIRGRAARLHRGRGRAGMVALRARRANRRVALVAPASARAL